MPHLYSALISGMEVGWGVALLVEAGKSVAVPWDALRSFVISGITLVLARAVHDVWTDQQLAGCHCARRPRPAGAPTDLFSVHLENGSRYPARPASSMTTPPSAMELRSGAVAGRRATPSAARPAPANMAAAGGALVLARARREDEVQHGNAGAWVGLKHALSKVAHTARYAAVLLASVATIAARWSRVLWKAACTANGAFVFFAIIIAFAAYGSQHSQWWWDRDLPGRCDARAPSSTFFRYYGLPGGFGALDADDIDFDHGAPDFFAGNFQPTMNSSSFVLYGLRGSGKTHVSKHLLKTRFRSDAHLVVDLRKDLKRYIDNAGRFNNQSSHADQYAMAVWTEDHLAGTVLSMLVRDLAAAVGEENRTSPLNENETVKMVVLSCLYYPDTAGIEPLLALLQTLNASLPVAALAQTSTHGGSGVKPVYAEAAAAARSIRVLRTDNDARLRVLTGYLEHAARTYTEVSSVLGVDTNRTDNMLREYAELAPRVFLRTVNIVVHMDRLDENPHFFGNSTANAASLQAFLDSTRILQSMAVDRMLVMAFFFPHTKGLDYDRVRFRSDKVLFLPLTWDMRQLAALAEHKFAVARGGDCTAQQLHAARACKCLPPFEELVALAETRDALGAALRHPRDLFIFLNELAKELNKYAREVDIPYRATPENVQNALKAAKRTFLVE
jgi:hypothetical protein